MGVERAVPKLPGSEKKIQIFQIGKHYFHRDDMLMLLVYF